MYGEFEGAGIIVLGGAAGIGAAVVEAFHGLGAKVAIVDKSESDATGLANELGRRSCGAPLFSPQVFAVDLAAEAERTSTLDLLLESMGPPRVVVSTIGCDQRFDFKTVPQERLEWSVRTNGIAPILAARQLLPEMRNGGGGVICLFTSRHGREIFESDALGYAGGKAFLEVGIQSLAMEAGKSNTPDNIIRVFGFCPGWVQTENQRTRYSRLAFEEALRTQLVPLETLADDVVPSVVYLCSNNAARFSGRIFYEDGGEGRLK